MQRLVPLALILSFVACSVQKSGEPARAPAEPSPATPTETAPQQQGYPPGQAAPTNLLRGEESRDFASLKDAERELERARRELANIVTDKDRRENKKAPEQPAPLAGGGSECGKACKAFASLRRAANAVCRLTDATDARCVRARSVVKDNETRIAACGCEPPKD